MSIFHSKRTNEGIQAPGMIADHSIIDKSLRCASSRETALTLPESRSSILRAISSSQEVLMDFFARVLQILKAFPCGQDWLKNSFREFVVRFPVQLAPRCRFPDASPLFEKERHSLAPALIPNRDDPFSFHRPCARAALSSYDYPIDSA